MRALYLTLIVVLISVGAVWGQESPPEAPPEPTQEPTAALPTETPTEAPTEWPTVELPTVTPTPTEAPTLEPTFEPTVEVTEESTEDPTETPLPELPTGTPTPFVIEQPTETPEPVETEAPPTRGNRGRGAKVDQDLLALYDALAINNLPAARQLAMDEEMLISSDGTRVRIEVVALDAAEALRLRPQVEALGGTYLIGFEHYAEYDFPLSMLDALNSLPGEFTARQPLRPMTQSGTVVSEGLGATGVQAWHARGYRGQGIRIGVIDVGFFGYPNADTSCVRGASAFDPLPVTLTAYGDHGTKVVEIICDLAPQAEVFIASANSVSALNAAVDWLIAQNVRLINMSMSWFDHPGDGTGPVNTIVNRAISRGILWVNSAGNSQGYVWHGAYSNATYAGSTYGFTSLTVNLMNFGSGPVLRLTGGCGRFEIGLRWSDWNAARTGRDVGYDLDLYLVQSTNGGSSWTHVAWSLKDQEGSASERPNEYIGISPTCTAGAIYGIIVRRWSTTEPAYLQIESYTHQLQAPSETASIATPADNPNVIAVAASEVKPHSFWSWSPQRYPDVAPYSSRGPTLGPGGTNPSGGTPKPDISAPTNTRTTRDSEFNGTSAAAPHATGVFAVALSANPFYTRSSLLSDFRRSPAASQYATCNTTPTLCFGSGILTMPSLWYHWSDLVREHTHHSVILSGIPESVSSTVAGDGRWVTINTASFPAAQRASGGTFVASRDRYAQIEFQYFAINGVQIAYYKMPGWTGCTMVVERQDSAGTTTTSYSLDGGSIHERVTLNVASVSPGSAVTVRMKSSSGGPCGGVTLDTITPIIGEVVQETDPRITFTGSWSPASLAGASGGGFRATTTPGASAYFITTSEKAIIVYTGRPDGGIAEVYVNGQYEGLFDTYAPAQTPQTIVQVLMAPAPTPKLVEIRAVGRRSPSSRGQTVTLDAIRFYGGMGGLSSISSMTAEALPARPSFAMMMAGAGVRLLPVNGVWNRVGSPAAFGGALWSSNTPGAEIIFRLDYAGTNRRLLVYFTGTPTGGQAEVFINGQVCASCGIIDTYRPSNMPRSVAVINLPDAAPSIMTVGLRITGERHLNSTGTSLLFEGAMILGSAVGSFTRLSYMDAAMDYEMLFDESMTPTHANQIVPRALPGAVYGDVHVTPTGVSFSASHQTIALILTRSPQGLQAEIEYYSTASGGTYKLLRTIDFNAARTLPRELVLLERPSDAVLSSGFWRVRVRPVNSQQTGGAPNFLFVDGVLGFGPGSIGTTAAILTGPTSVMAPDPRRQEIGTGWVDAPAAITAPTFSGNNSAPMRRTNAPGASLQFTYDPSMVDLILVYSRHSDGGIAEVYVDGVRIGEINFYSPTPLYRQILIIPQDTTKTIATVEIRNTNRRSPGSTGNWMYIDVLAPSARVLSAYHTSGSAEQETSSYIQRIGTGWATLPAAPVGVNGPLGAAAQSVNQPGAVRFRISGPKMWLVRTLLPNGGQAEVYVDGVRCPECGLVSFFNPVPSYRAAHLLQIPASYGGSPYVIELRALPTRPQGSTGTVMTLDAVVPVVGSLTAMSYTEFTTTSSTGGSFTSVTLPSSSNGSILALNNDVIRTTAASGCAYVTAPSANPRVTVYYTRQPSGGIAEIRTGPSASSLATCLECGTINSYSPTAQYMVPHSFIAPVSAGQLIAVCQTGARQQGSTGFTLELDAVLFR
ncbi:MAG: S8 family serine peptidase [Anaerolinea sp.]